MNLMDITQSKLEGVFGKPVPETYIMVAKHVILGVGVADIAEIIGAEENEVTELLESDEDYKEIEGYIRKQYASAQADVDISWDGIEAVALANLSKSIQNDHDPDLNLRVAAVANKAQRRHSRRATHTLTPSGGAHVHLKLTKRFVEKLNGGGAAVEKTIEMTIDSANPPSQTELGGLFDFEESAEGGASTRGDAPENLLEQLTSGMMDV